MLKETFDADSEHMPAGRHVRVKGKTGSEGLRLTSNCDGSVPERMPEASPTVSNASVSLNLITEHLSGSGSLSGFSRVSQLHLLSEVTRISHDLGSQGRGTVVKCTFSLAQKA